MMRADARSAARLGGRAGVRVWSLHRLLTVVPVAAGALLCLAVAAIIVLNARHAIEDETASAFRTAQATIAVRMPPRFAGGDTMGTAINLAAEIDALRHVAAHVVDTRGTVLSPESIAAGEDDPAPGWFTDLMRPEIRSHIIPVSHYPNVLGSLIVSTDPGDEIAEVWEDFRIIMPLLALTAALLVGMTMAVSRLILGRLRAVQDALEAMRQGELLRRAPPDSLAEFAVLAEGVNALADHLRAERAENDTLHARLLTLSETERASIASDLHDEMGPQLFALNAALAQAQAALAQLSGPGRDQLEDALRATALHAGAVRDSARAAINELRPMLSGHASLPEMLDELVIEFADIAPEAGIRLEVTGQIDAEELSQLAIYRFVRESLLNAIRHGHARHIRIDLAAGAGQIVTRITDDGDGPSGRLPARSHGLTGIRDRARALGATFLPPRRMGRVTVTELRMPAR